MAKEAKVIAMQVERRFDSAPDYQAPSNNSIGGNELASRVDRLIRLKSRSAHTPSDKEERRFQEVISRARDAASSGDKEAMADALFEIDMMSFKLCDD